MSKTLVPLASLPILRPANGLIGIVHQLIESGNTCSKNARWKKDTTFSGRFLTQQSINSIFDVIFWDSLYLESFFLDSQKVQRECCFPKRLHTFIVGRDCLSERHRCCCAKFFAKIFLIFLCSVLRLLCVIDGGILPLSKSKHKHYCSLPVFEFWVSKVIQLANLMQGVPVWSKFATSFKFIAGCKVLASCHLRLS